jgi:hypothetical protein
MLTIVQKMTLKDFVRKLIDIQLGMINVHIKVLRDLRDKAESEEYSRGVQDCIDILEESMLTGMSITDDEIHKKEREMEAALETIMANRGDN